MSGISDIRGEGTQIETPELSKSEQGLKLLAECDLLFADLDSLQTRLGQDDYELTDEDKSLMNRFIEKIGEIEVFKNYLEYENKCYFDHDAASIVRGSFQLSQFLLNVWIKEYGLKRVKDFFFVSRSSRGDHFYELSRKNWECARLIMQDLYIRGSEKRGEYVKQNLVERYRGETASRLLQAIKDRFEEKTKMFGQKSLVFEGNEEELKSLLLCVPAGIVFNFLQNCLSNATDSRIFCRNIDGTVGDNSLRKISLTIKQEDNFLVFSLVDNGRGMTDEQKEKIFEPGISFKPRNEIGRHGLGLAYGDKRMSAVGCELELETSDNKDFTNKGMVTTFTLKVPIKK